MNNFIELFEAYVNQLFDLDCSWKPVTVGGLIFLLNLVQFQHQI